ncbi:APC family permease [Bacillus sp. REN10]|uniref:APC family permease n=1 Tax=Bacillus sp. REN10 TaxID=2782541 RepID=UPI00193C741F|nr:APC family permease [Bacillus sp. REN10]
MSIEQFGYKEELKRVLTFKDLLIYGLIFMLPIAPFGVFGYVFEVSNGMVPLAYMIGMAGMIFTAMSYARMSEAFPVAGSVYAYAQRGINEYVGFICGWVILLDYILIPALSYIVSASALTAFMPSVPKWIWLFFFIVINTVINIRGIEFTAKANKVILTLIFIVLAVFIVVGLSALYGGAGAGQLTIKPFYDVDAFSLPLVMGAVSIAVLSFLGFDAISTLSEEVQGGKQTVGKATIATLLCVGTLFIVQTWIASDLGRGMTIKNLDTYFYEIAGVAGGTWLKNVTILATAFSWGIASSLVAQAAIARVLFSMGRDRKLPSVLAKVHPKYKTPYVSTVLVAFVSLFVCFLFQEHTAILTNVVNFGALTAFLMLHISVINHFIIRQKSKQYMKYLVLPLIGAIVIGYVLYGMDILAIKVGLGWTMLGIVYLGVLTKVYKEKPASLEI